MEEKEKQLLIATSEIFLVNGIKSMTMDDIARELKMSKKTLYKYVKDKNDLVSKAMELTMREKECEFDDICSTTENSIEELWKITLKASEQLKVIHPSVMYDMQRFYPEAWGHFENHKNTHIYKCVKDNLINGQKSGVYRSDINPEIITKLYIARFDVMFDYKIFPPSKFTLFDIHQEMMNYHFFGILSEEGIKQYKEYELKK